MQQPDYEGAEFTGLSMAGATFREVDLSGARMHGVVLFNADIDPERLRLRPATPETMRDAVDVIEELWHATVRRAGTLPAEAAYRNVASRAHGG